MLYATVIICGMLTPKSKPGRKPAEGVARDQMRFVRLTKDEAVRLDVCADKAKKTASVYVRDALLEKLGPRARW